MHRRVSAGAAVPEHRDLAAGRRRGRVISAAQRIPAMRYSKIAPRHGYRPQARAIGSAGERLVHTEEVTGSIPVSPTLAGTKADKAPKLVKPTVGVSPGERPARL